jgi:YD repeat-containing protein
MESFAIQIVTLEDASNIPQTYRYDSLGNVIRYGSGADVVSSNYSPEGVLLSKQDSFGNSVSYNYDLNGSLISAVDSGFYGTYGGSNSCGTFDNYTYDVDCNVINDEIYIYDYDSRGNLANKTSLNTSEITSYQYDASNRLIRIDFADGNYTTYTYGGGDLCKISSSFLGTFYSSPFDSSIVYEEDLVNSLTPCSGDCGEIEINWSCEDGIQNGWEEGVDCGTSCWNECGVPSNDLVAYYKLDNNGRDELGLNNLTGNLIYGEGKVLNASIFDGTSNIKVYTAASNYFRLNNFTLGTWVNFSGSNAVGKYYRILSTKNGNYGFLFTYSNKVISFLIGNGSALGGVRADYNLLSGWHYIMASYNGTTGTIYLDGRFLSSDKQDLNYGATTPRLSIGGEGTTGAYPWNGLIDEVKIWNKSMSSDEALSIYQSYPIPCVENWSCGNWGECINDKKIRTCVDTKNCGTTLNKPEIEIPCGNINLVSYYNFDRNANDSTGLNNLSSNVNYFLIGKKNQSAIFDGTSAKKAYSQQTNSFKLNNFTISTWVLFLGQNLPSTYYRIAGTKSGNYGYTISYSNKIISLIAGNGLSLQRIDFNYDLNASGRWQLITVSYNGSTTKLYLNGTLAKSSNININYGTIVPRLSIGGEGTTGAYPWNGLIDELKIWNRTLSDAEILQEYNS